MIWQLEFNPAPLQQPCPGHANFPVTRLLVRIPAHKPAREELGVVLFQDVAGALEKFVCCVLQDVAGAVP